jgi:hypothetical protein
VAFGSRKRLGEEFADSVGREARPSGEEIVLDGLGPSRNRGAEAGPVEEIY